MCGIVGCVAEEPVSGILLDGLRRIEYRGYDSAGMATISNGKLSIRKGAGRISKIEGRKKLSLLKGNIGMAHTRWATHGGVIDRNAHPHTACNGRIAVIHNGIIENYLPLKKGLTSKGHKFKSETDTEVIAHLIEEEYEKTKDPLKATMRATRRLTGQHAIAVLFKTGQTS